MAFAVSPAVIVKEIDATYGTVATASRPAAIAGVFSWGPVMEPILITSEENLVSRFGKPTNDNYETFFTTADFLSYSDRVYVVRTIDGALKSTSSIGTIEAKYPGSLGNVLEVSYITNRASNESSIGIVGALGGDIEFGTSEIEFSSVVAITAASVGDNLRIGNNSIGYQETLITSFTDLGFDSDANVYQYKIGIANPYSLIETDISRLSLTRLWKYASLVNTPLDDGHVHIVVSDVNGTISGLAGSVLETYINVSLSPSAKKSDGTANFYRIVIENRSNWISPDDTDITNTPAPVYTVLTGGTDGNSESAASFGSVALGYDKFCNSEEIDISFILQGKPKGGIAESGLANYILSNIVSKRNDVILTISPSLTAVEPGKTSSDKISGITVFRAAIQNSSYWVMDSGYKYRYDKYNDVYRWVPLNGDVAGLMARSEFFESPAGYKRGMIRNTVKIAFNPNKAERDLLWGMDVNPVFTQVGTGTVLFGDKTGLGADSAFNRINVRRVFIEAEKAVATVAAQFLFDFNDEFTRAQFRNSITPWFKNLQGRRGLIDYRIVVDERNNDGDVIDANQMRGAIFLKVSRSISEIRLDFIATKTDVTFEESINQIL